MVNSRMSRETLLPLLASHVLQEGLGGASLRPLAKAAGTSDRMLIYHFDNKERLVVTLLAHLAEDYAKLLDQAFGPERAPSRAACLERVLRFSDHPDAAPYLTLWWDIVAGAARDLPGYRVAARQVMQRLLEWLEAQMPVDDPDPAGGARYLLTIIEGAQMLRAVGRGDIADAGIEALPPSP